MKFTITTEKGSTIEMETGMTLEVEIDGIMYEISIKEK